MPRFRSSCHELRKRGTSARQRRAAGGKLVHDAPALVLAAHSLRGASGNLGAIELAKLCTTLESDGTAGDLEHGTVLLSALEAEFDRVRTALEPWISPC